MKVFRVKYHSLFWETFIGCDSIKHRIQIIDGSAILLSAWLLFGEASKKCFLLREMSECVIWFHYHDTVAKTPKLISRNSIRPCRKVTSEIQYCHIPERSNSDEVYSILVLGGMLSLLMFLHSSPDRGGECYHCYQIFQFQRRHRISSTNSQHSQRREETDSRCRNWSDPPPSPSTPGWEHSSRATPPDLTPRYETRLNLVIWKWALQLTFEQNQFPHNEKFEHNRFPESCIFLPIHMF